jgi:hypothetical protein
MKRIIYFFDTSAAQNKKKKNFLHLTLQQLECWQSGISLPLLTRRVHVKVLVKLLKDLQHEPVCNDSIQTKLWFQGSFFEWAHLNLSNINIIFVTAERERKTFIRKFFNNEPSQWNPETTHHFYQSGTVFY